MSSAGHRHHTAFIRVIHDIRGKQFTPGQTADIADSTDESQVQDVEEICSREDVTYFDLMTWTEAHDRTLHSPTHQANVKSQFEHGTRLRLQPA